MRWFNICLCMGLLCLATGAQARKLTPMERALLALNAKASAVSNTTAAVGQSGNTLTASVSNIPLATTGKNGNSSLLSEKMTSTSQDPLGLTVTATADSVMLGWSNTATAWSGFAGYRVMKARAHDPWQPALPTLVTETRYTDLTITSDTEYAYQVTALDAKGTTLVVSERIILRTLIKDAFNLVLAPGTDSMGLSWSNTGTAWGRFAGYRVIKALSGEPGQALNPTLLLETRFQDLTVTAATDYTYQVVALDSQGGTLVASTIVSGRPTTALPPGSIRDLEVSSEEERVNLKWSRADAGSRLVAGYNIFRAGAINEQGVPLNVTPWAQITFNDDRGVMNQKYYYTVVPVDAKGLTGNASAPMAGFAKPRSRSSLIWTSTAYPAVGSSPWTGDLQFTYYIGTLYGQERTYEPPTSTYLDPISLWLLSADMKYSFLSELQSPVAMAVGAKAGLQLFAGQQSAASGSFTFSSKSQLDYLWSGYLSMSRSFGKWGVHAGYMQGTFSSPIFYLSKYLENESVRNTVYFGTDFPIARRMNATLEILCPLPTGGSQHPFLANLHVDRLLNFDIAYLHWDMGWAFLGYFNIRFTVFPGS